MSAISAEEAELLIGGGRMVMSIETLEELKAIRDNAPEGANYATKNHYLMVDGLHCKIFNSLGVWSVPVCNAADILIDEKPRSLSDINRIIDLMEAAQGLLQVFSGVQDGYWRNELNAARKALGYKV